MERGNGNIVAVIDDDNDVGAVLGRLLETMGYQVEIFTSALEFLSSARTDRLACLIVDQNMPRMTGLEMIEKLSEQGVSIPTLLITGVYDSAVDRRASELGVMTVLEKPMSHRDLLRFVSVSVG